MDHIVYVEASSKEMNKILNGEKTMILRGASGRKMPYGRVETGDVLYFMNNNGEGVVKARANVKSVFNSEMLAPEVSMALIEQNQKYLLLSKKQKERFGGKRYLVLIEIENPEEIKPMAIDKSDFSTMDDWLRVGKISSVLVAAN
ncbi:MAG: hypothetical protein HF314_11470 [Ignavibacteria bacterium]|jgi:hypothetical protein|nr:hypothetical protein [Ignavibacteria bacterium]MCU7503688.1 hypothetical protein [Ignavibacteria bacterium]MCU7517665.1 hypothetical protein [Ignavibacteria bacterium]